MTASAAWKVVAGFAAAALVAAAAGCRGTPAPGETEARAQLDETARAYRPQGAKPALPELSVESTVGDLLSFAVLNSPSVEAAFYDYSAAVEEIAVERSYPDPMFQLSAEIADTVDALTPGLMTDPMANWPLPSKLRLKGEAALRMALSKRSEVRAAMLETAYSVKRAWYQMWALDEEIRLTRETMAVVDRMERFALDRIAVGAATQQDALRAQMERDQLEIGLESLIDSRETVRARMRGALALPESAVLPEFQPKLADGEEAVGEQALLAVALARNPRLEAMRQDVMQAVALYELAGKAGVPDFAFGLEANVKGSPVPFMPAVGVTLPIWRDRIAAEIAASRARAGAAQSRLEAEQLDLAVRFAETAYALREADRNVGLYGERLTPKARAALDVAESGYVAGVTGFLDLLEAEKTVLEFETQRVKALGERQMALAEMSLVILAEWPEDWPATLSDNPAQPAAETQQPMK